jgi:hypothetical protein
MITIGAYFGEGGQQDLPIGVMIRSAMNAAANARGDWTEGSAPAVNVVFYVPGSVAQYESLTQIEASRFSRKQKLLLVAVPVPKEVADAGGSIDFVIDALHKANAIAAEVFAKKGSESFDLAGAEAIVERVREALVAQRG